MSNIIEAIDVFTFMGTASDVNTEQTNAMTELITEMQNVLERELGRKITSNTATAVLFQDGLNCEIFKDKLFLRNEFRDMYSITALSETGSALTAATGYNDGGDYYHDTRKGVLIRIDSYWSLEQLAISITGKYGLVNQSDDSALEGIRLILLNSVAAKSGQWKNSVQTEDGTIESIRTKIPTDVEAMKKRYVLRDF